MHCTLCGNSDTLPYLNDETGSYNFCPQCHLVFQDPKTYFEAREEKEIYDSHENDSTDLNYRNFLNRLILPLIGKISKGDKGLDFGCGPGPTISVMLAEEGFSIDNYDLYYTKDFLPEKDAYEFITSTEVFEHFYQPGKEIDRIWSLLKRDGVLGIMTVFRPSSLEEFGAWWYKKDPTHVCFYSKETFEYLANKLNAELEIIGNQVAFLRKL